MNPTVELVLKHKKANMRKSEFLMLEALKSAPHLKDMRSKMKWRSGLSMGIEDLTRVVNRLMVSSFIPAPFFLAAWRMVLQMLPGRENG